MVARCDRGQTEETESKRQTAGKEKEKRTFLDEERVIELESETAKIGSDRTSIPN